MYDELNLISCFDGRYEFLSNFFPAKIYYDGILYHNSEAAYQAQKSELIENRKRFSGMMPGPAKRLGGKLPVRPDWDDVKLNLMREILWAKFTQNPVLAQRLIDTGAAKIAEGNYWGDRFWGVDSTTGEGENHLGRLLMELRHCFRQDGIPRNRHMPEEHEVSFGGHVHLTDGDITCLNVECIVRAAAMPLTLGDGVGYGNDARSVLPPECRKLEDCKEGEAKLSSDFIQNAHFSILTRGPSYLTTGDCTLLNCCYWNCLELAMQNDLHSIAFPIISLGKFRFPKEIAVACAVDSVLSWIDLHPASDMQITLACTVPDLFELAETRINRMMPSLWKSSVQGPG